MGVVKSRDGDCLKFKPPNHIPEIPEARIVKFLKQVATASLSKRMTYHPQNGRSYGHVTVFKFVIAPDAARRAGLSNCQ